MGVGVQRLSSLDALLLSADAGNQHVHVLATLLLDGSDKPGGATYADFRQRVHERWTLVEPMRRKLQWMPWGAPVWVDADDIHLDEHLHHVTVDGGGIGTLSEVAGRIASHPLPRDRPLWEAWFVDGLDDGRVGVIAKIHHAAVDGVSGIWSLAGFFDLEPDPATAPELSWEPDSSRPTLVELGRLAVDDLRARPKAVADGVRGLATSLRSMTTARNPDAPLPFSGPSLSFNGALSSQRSVAFARVDLDEVKAIRRAHGVTVNDVVMALVAGVLRNTLQANDELPDGPLVAAVPVSERQPHHGMSGNRFSAMLYALPVHEAEPVDRLRSAARAGAAAKELYERMGTGLAEHAAGLVPPVLTRPVMELASRLRIADRLAPAVNVIVSNVRGPEFPLYAAGARLESMFPMGPLMEGVGLGVNVVGYEQEIDVGFIACPELVPDVANLAEDVHAELAVLTKTR